MKIQIHNIRSFLFCPALQLCVPSSSVRVWWFSSSVVSAVLQLGLSAPVKLSDSGRSGSQAGRGPESAATQPGAPHAHDSASGMADP